MSRKSSCSFLFLLLLPSLLLSLALSLFPSSFPSSHFVLVSPSVRALPSAFCPPVKFARLPREGPSCRSHLFASCLSPLRPLPFLCFCPVASCCLFCFYFSIILPPSCSARIALLFYISILRTLVPVLFFLLFFPFYAFLPL